MIRQYKWIAVFIALMLIVTACGEANSAAEHEDFNSDSFSDSTNVDNTWFPLKPGMQYVYEGFTNDDNGNRISRRLVVIVTDLTKVIGGVRSVVSWDRDYNADKLVEAELAFYAQDDGGTVWRMGEHPEEYEDGKFITAPTWMHGIENANAGIEMLAEPELQTDYSQGWAPAVDFTDRGQVSQVGQKVCVTTTCYENVLVIDETNKSEPDAHQLKYYAPGVGNIKVDWNGEDQTQETLELVEVTQLTPDAMAEARTEALKEEQHAYEVSPDVYAKTSPIEYPPGTPAISVPASVVEDTPQVNNVPQGSASEVIVYASDLQESDLSELEFIDDADSPGGKLIGLPNNGDELDPPPENDPHLTFRVQVQSGVPYRCWIHMKVGTPKGRSQANVIWAQFSDVVDQSNKETLKPGTASYLTAQGPEQEGWSWVGCNSADAAQSLVYFGINGEVTVRLQAGAEGVGFDQLLLSSEKFLKDPPAVQVVEK